MFVTAAAPHLTFASSTEDFHVFFVDLTSSKGLAGCTTDALATIRPDLLAVGVVIQTNGAGDLRGRIFLPTAGGGALKGDYSRTVDICENGQNGGAWTWVVR
jgi:hypothetical protein